MPSMAERIYGERHVEDKAADAVKDATDYTADAVKNAADYTADAIGDARDELNSSDKSLWERTKERISDTAESVKETLFGEHTAEDRVAAAVTNASNEAADAISDFRYEINRDDESLLDKTKEKISDTAESVRDTVFGERNAEDKAANAVKNTADKTADTIGNVRDDMNRNDESLLERTKEKISDTATSVKESLFGEHNAEDRLAAAVTNASNEAADAISDFRYEINRDDESLLDRTKEKISDTAESVKESVFGGENVEYKAADAVKNAADKTADTIGNVRDEMNRNDESLLERTKEKISDTAESVRDTVFGERNAEDKAADAVKDAADRTAEIFREANENLEDARQLHDF